MQLELLPHSHFQSHTFPIFKETKFAEAFRYSQAPHYPFYHQYHKGSLPEPFNNFFTLVKDQYHV